MFDSWFDRRIPGFPPSDPDIVRRSYIPMASVRHSALATWRLRPATRPVTMARPVGPPRKRSLLSRLVALLPITAALTFVVYVIGSAPVETWDGSDTEMRLGELVLKMAPGTLVALPRAPGRWFHRTATVSLASGEIRGTTGDRPLDFGLVIRTREMTARIASATFALRRTPSETTLDVLDGTIEVMPRQDNLRTIVPAQKRYSVSRSVGRAAMQPLE
jgi:ferric-dicitrate binding protein FerR (iron transport regulator)